MYVVIVGCSESGYHLSKALIAGGHEVVVIDKDPERYQLLNEELGSVALLGDGTDEVTLKRAGIARADVVVSLTGADATNLVVSQMTKHIFNVPKVVCHLGSPQLQVMYAALGLDVVGYSFGLLQDVRQAIQG